MIDSRENNQPLAEAQLIRKETSPGRIVYHAIKYAELPSADPRRDAALEAMCALLVRIVRPTSVGGTLLGLFGAWIAWQTWQTSLRQEQLVSKQDELIETQNVISDEVRRQADRAELADILKELRGIEEAREKGTPDKGGNENPEKREKELSLKYDKRVIRLTNALTPHAGTVINTKIEATGPKPVMTVRDRATSPERAALLRALLDAGVMTDGIRDNGNFSFADFSDETLKGYDFSRLNLRFSDFRGALVTNCRFIRASFDDADLSSYQKIGRIRVVRPSSKEESLTLFSKCDFRSASLKRTKFRETSCLVCTFSSATAIEVYFMGAKLALCRFDGSNFQDSNFDRAEITDSILPAVTTTLASVISSDTVEADLASYNSTYALWTNCSWSGTIFRTDWVSQQNWSAGLPNGFARKLKVSVAPQTTPEFIWLDQEVEPNSWLARGKGPKDSPYVVNTEEPAEL